MKILSVAMFNIPLSSGNALRSYFSRKDLAIKIHEAAGKTGSGVYFLRRRLRNDGYPGIYAAGESRNGRQAEEKVAQGSVRRFLQLQNSLILNLVDEIKTAAFLVSL